MNKAVNPADLVAEAESLGLEICPVCKVAKVQGLCNCSKNAKAEAEAPKQEEEKAIPQFRAKSALQRIPGAPSEAQINEWKQMFGAVYTLPFSDKEIYIWRYLTRSEFQALMMNQELVQKESLLQETIVNRALLWPKLDPVQMASSRAGLVSTLYGVIMQGSYFVDPLVAINMVEEL